MVEALKDAREGNIVVTGTTEPAAATGVTHMVTHMGSYAPRIGTTALAQAHALTRPARAGMLATMSLVWVLGVAATDVEAQAGDEEAAVMAVVDRLFDGMRANDADMVRSAFVDGALLIGTEGPDGSPQTSYLSVDDFATMVGSATQPWDEPYWDPIVQIRDHLATVWIKYAFYLDGTFSHCGIDALILTQTDEGWKIAALADTRERDNCELPPDRQP